ncbi:hypothetical protein [Microbulbifer magnicolonia]|uniref:hypothetical protein n=1 Tax=Microbulbifer magnicolonia TaxID=3109744 RepID=UPI002B415416|nr:hypothetical protein [Microbulbifer sp. GG15]
MEELLNNGWVVGVGGGVLSGLIVAWLTRTLFSKKDQRELAISIGTANKEILYAIRPEISENSLPSTEVIEALRNATARKYKVEVERLHGTAQIVEDLIKEIMDSSFISSSSKKGYCEALSTLIQKETKELQADIIDREAFVARVEYKEKMTSLLSMTLGTIVALGTMLSFIKGSFESSTLFGKVADSVFPMILVIFSVMLVMTAMQVALKLRHKRIRAENGIPIDESFSNHVN